MPTPPTSSASCSSSRLGSPRHRDHPEGGDLSAGGFIRVAGDETDALALVFVLRDLSEHFSCRVGIRDPDNPIAKLRTVDLVNGRLADQPRPRVDPRATADLQADAARKPGSRCTRPGRSARAFGTIDGVDGERRAWSFLVHGMRDSRPSFLEAEAEAMRMWRGLRFLE